MAYKSTNIYPTARQAAFFRSTYRKQGDLMTALHAFKREFGIEDKDRWCTLNAVLVAEAAILSDKEDSYEVYSGKASTSKGGSHVAGVISGKVYDCAALQYGPNAKMSYTSAPSHFRDSFLEAAQEALDSIPDTRSRLDRTASSLRVLLRLRELL